jgi:hypothetical protein
MVGHPSTPTPGDAERDPRGQLRRLDLHRSGLSAQARPGERKLARAARLSGLKRYLTYGKLDLDLARDAAPLAAYGNATSDDLFSARIGCQTYGFYDMDIAALCLRPPRDAADQ